MTEPENRQNMEAHLTAGRRSQRWENGNVLLKSVIDALPHEGIHKAALVVFPGNRFGNRFREHAGFATRPDRICRHGETTAIQAENWGEFQR